MNIKSTITLLISGLILMACASDPIDPLNPKSDANSDLPPQCPIGYKPVFSTEIVVKSSDKDKKAGQTTQGFKCEPER